MAVMLISGEVSGGGRSPPPWKKARSRCEYMTNIQTISCDKLKHQEVNIFVARRRSHYALIVIYAISESLKLNRPRLGSMSIVFGT